VLPALAVLAAARAARMPVSAVMAALPSRHTASDRLPSFPGEESRPLLERWTLDPSELLAGIGLRSSGSRVDTTDGLRITLASNEVVHLRPSGNAPELRCYAEAASAVRAVELVRHALGFIADRRRLPA
jgi:phosphomannomutase